MSSQRSKDLTNDLLQDLAATEVAPPEKAPAASRPSEGSPSAVVETALFLSPRRWSRPRIARTGALLSMSAGPVRLRGWSFGGALALRLAVELRRRGRTLGFVGMLDTHRTATASGGDVAARAEGVARAGEDDAARSLGRATARLQHSRRLDEAGAHLRA